MYHSFETCQYVYIFELDARKSRNDYFYVVTVFYVESNIASIHKNTISLKESSFMYIFLELKSDILIYV